MKRVHVHGAGGRMGSATAAAVQEAHDLELCGTSGRNDDLARALARSQPDVVVEFSVPHAVERNVRTILEASLPVVCGTTGLASSAVAALGELAASKGVGFLLAPNFALGMLLLQRFCRQAVVHLADVEIIEMHHDGKKDAPSGTALHTAAQIAAAARQPLNAGRPPAAQALPHVRGGQHHGIPIHSIRLPGLLAHQEVIFGAVGEVLTIRHDTLERCAFMPGVLLAIRRIERFSGLVDSLERMLDDAGR